VCVDIVVIIIYKQKTICTGYGWRIVVCVCASFCYSIFSFSLFFSLSLCAFFRFVGLECAAIISPLLADWLRDFIGGQSLHNDVTLIFGAVDLRRRRTLSYCFISERANAVNCGLFFCR